MNYLLSFFGPLTLKLRGKHSFQDALANILVDRPTYHVCCVDTKQGRPDQLRFTSQYCYDNVTVDDIRKVIGKYYWNLCRKEYNYSTNGAPSLSAVLLLYFIKKLPEWGRTWCRIDNKRSEVLVRFENSERYVVYYGKYDTEFETLAG